MFSRVLLQLSLRDISHFNLKQMDGQIRETLLSALLGVVQCLLSNFIYKRKPYRNITDKKTNWPFCKFQDHGFSHCYTLLWPSLKFALTKNAMVYV